MGAQNTVDKTKWCHSCKDGKPDECEFGGLDCETHYRKIDEEDAAADKAWAAGTATVANPTPPATPPTSPYITTKSPEIPAKTSYGYDGYGGSYASRPTGGSGYVKPASGGGLPFALKFKCLPCGHWFENDDKLARHAQWACPAENNNLSFAIPCLCCDTLDKSIRPRSRVKRAEIFGKRVVKLLGF